MLLLAVGSGVGEGEFVNRAQAMSALTGSALSGEASATVRIVPDPALDCTDVIGKVFDDGNRNGLQDEGEQRHPARASRDGARLARDDGSIRPLPHHVRDHAARGPRQQLRAEARRPHAAERLPRLDAVGAGPTRDAR